LRALLQDRKLADSAVGGASVSFAMLVTARACQGAFAALLVPSALSLLTTTFTARTDKDHQARGEQGVSVEDALSMVHISYGMKEPHSPHLRSECAILAGLARATLPASRRARSSKPCDLTESLRSTSVQ
jgi:hypothetical protein